MGRSKKTRDVKEQTFKRLFGVTRETFEKMKSVLQKEYDELHRQGGSPLKLSREDKLTITRKYYREYRTMESIETDYGVSKSTVCQTIQWVEEALSRAEAFKLPGKKAPARTPQEIQCVVVDATESPIQRPKKTKKSIIQGKRSGIR
jgi:transposase-like protein